MEITARVAAADDLEQIVSQYQTAIEEQAALRPVGPLVEGWASPVTQTLAEILDDPRSIFAVGEIDGAPVGFIWARSEPLAARAGGERIGVVRMVFTDHAARGVGVGEAMLTLVMDQLRRQGHRRFDAIVAPGHRLAKNFFERAGFAARRITMYREERS